MPHPTAGLGRTPPAATGRLWVTSPPIVALLPFTTRHVTRPEKSRTPRLSGHLDPPDGAVCQLRSNQELR